MNQPKVESQNTTILDDLAMARIKQYIQRKHPDFTSAQRAALFANAIHRIIDQHLPDFKEKTKVVLRRELLARIGMGQRFTIMSQDILEACLKLDLEESGISQLANWMDKNQLVAGDTALGVRKAWGRSGEGERLESVSTQVTNNLESFLMRFVSSRALYVTVIIFSLVFACSSSQTPIASNEQLASGELEYLEYQKQLSTQPVSVLPSAYMYRSMNEDKLRAWLQERQSLLADEPYFSEIIQAAQDSNIHPLLLFAITGQEQAYVPKDNKKAKQIANNPFNIYNSWKSYNTNIADSARIASKTILSISQNRPADVHPIAWLNTKYAEDPNWWVGVTAIFEKMKREIEEDN